MRKQIFLAVCGALIMSVPAYASSGEKESRSVDPETAQRIDTAYQKTARGARLMGKKRLHYQNRVKRLDNVLERLEAGEDVDPREINALIR